MIETYWNEMFGEFKTGERQFSLPGFPEPLMSPHFGVTNIIEDSGSGFKLCLFRPKCSEISPHVKNEDLESTLTNLKFWEFQQTHHQEGHAFMQRLLPFLVKNKKPHRHFFMEQDEQLIVSCLVGEVTSSVFMFNAAVHSKRRNKGLMQIVMNSIQGHFYPKATFYWTKHQWFTNGADEVLDYRLSTKV